MAFEWARRAAVLVPLATAPSGSAQQALVGGLLYESPALVAPVVVLTSLRDLTEWRVAIVGWTINGEWARTLSPSRAVVAALDLTPVNAHSSNKVYVDGVEDAASSYRNATLQVSGGLRWTPSSRWSTDLRGAVLYEHVADLPPGVLDFWRSPFVGLDVVHRYDRVSANDPLRARFEGVRVAARAQAYAGTAFWGRGTLSIGVGHRVGRLFLRGHGLALYGRSLNTVSAFLTGGSWDAAGPAAFYGYGYGAHRLDRALLANGGVDVRLWGTAEIGLRAAWLTGPEGTRFGTAVGLSGLWNGIAMNVGLAIPEDDALRGRWDRALVTGGITAAWLR
jgi:hypothetical protein